MNVVWFRFLCNLHVVHFQPADPHVLFCILYVHFFWGFGQRIVAQLFFFSLDFFRGPHHLPRLKVLFLPGKNQKPEIFTPEAFSGMPRNLLLRVLSGVRPQKPQTPQAQRLHFHHFQNFQMMLWGNEEPPQFLVGFYRRLYGTSQVTLYCYIGIISSHYMDPHQPTIQLTLFPCEALCYHLVVKHLWWPPPSVTKLFDSFLIRSAGSYGRVGVKDFRKPPKKRPQVSQESARLSLKDS